MKAVDKSWIIGIDIGGTKIEAGLVEAETGRICESLRKPTPTEGNQSILECIYKMARHLAAQSLNQISGIGVGIPGIIDRHKGVAISAGNLNFRNMPIKQYLEERLDIFCQLENDANAWVLGEKWFGWGRSLENFIYMAIGTGIGGGLVFGGKLYLGQGAAGEIGHMIIDPAKPKCSCGVPGCLETLASGTAISKIAGSRMAEGEDSLLKEQWESSSTISAADVLQAASSGDCMSIRIIQEVGEYLAYTCVNLVRLLDPEAIIIGGGVAQSGHILMNSILEAVPAERMKRHINDILHFSRLNSGVAGAASIILEQS
jgi:glucokinase-like ROK family protein